MASSCTKELKGPDFKDPQPLRILGEGKHSLLPEFRV